MKREEQSIEQAFGDRLREETHPARRDFLESIHYGRETKFVPLTREDLKLDKSEGYYMSGHIFGTPDSRNGIIVHELRHAWQDRVLTPPLGTDISHAIPLLPIRQAILLSSLIEIDASFYNMMGYSHDLMRVMKKEKSYNSVIQKQFHTSSTSLMAEQSLLQQRGFHKFEAGTSIMAGLSSFSPLKHAWRAFEKGTGAFLAKTDPQTDNKQGQGNVSEEDVTFAKKIIDKIYRLPDGTPYAFKESDPNSLHEVARDLCGTLFTDELNKEIARAEKMQGITTRTARLIQKGTQVFTNMGLS